MHASESRFRPYGLGQRRCRLDEGRDGKAGAATIIGELLHDYTPPESEPEPELLPEEPTDVVEGLKSGAMDELMSNPHYRMLGLVDTAIAIHGCVTRPDGCSSLARERFTQPANVGRPSRRRIWWCGWAGIEKLTRETCDLPSETQFH